LNDGLYEKRRMTLELAAVLHATGEPRRLHINRPEADMREEESFD
jgi:hypothetical protein